MSTVSRVRFSVCLSVGGGRQAHDIASLDRQLSRRVVRGDPKKLLEHPADGKRYSRRRLTDSVDG